MTERNWYEDNYELAQRVTRAEGRVDAVEDNITKLETNQDRIFGKLDKLSGKVFLIIGIGVAVQALLSWILPAIRNGNP